MNNLYENILYIVHNYYKYFLKLENVNGVGLGFKYVNGINTKELCIHVLVENKINEKYLSKYNIIPKTYMGVKTDVIIVKRPRMREGNKDAVFKGKYRPLQGGCSITPYNKEHETYFGGTLGCIVTKVINDVREYFILSNSHVLSGLNTIPIGNEIIQPIFEYGRKGNSDVIAYLTDYVPIQFIEKDYEPVNYIDAAIAKLIDNNLRMNKIINAGKIRGKSKPVLGMKVKKSGFVTGLTFGTIKTINAEFILQASEDKQALYKDLIIIDGLKNDDGDSGSILLDKYNKAVGHFLAGDDEFNEGFASSIDKVLDAFNVDIYLDG